MAFHSDAALSAVEDCEIHGTEIRMGKREGISEDLRLEEAIVSG